VHMSYFDQTPRVSSCRILSPAPHVFDGLCALFELFLLHILVTIAGVRVALLITDRPLARVSQMLHRPYSMDDFFSCA
jgi:hypothetical protein